MINVNVDDTNLIIHNSINNKTQSLEEKNDIISKFLKSDKSENSIDENGVILFKPERYFDVYSKVSSFYINNSDKFSALKNLNNKYVLQRYMIINTDQKNTNQINTKYYYMVKDKEITSDFGDFILEYDHKEQKYPSSSIWFRKDKKHNIYAEKFPFNREDNNTELKEYLNTNYDKNLNCITKNEKYRIKIFYRFSLMCIVTFNDYN